MLLFGILKALFIVIVGLNCEDSKSGPVSSHPSLSGGRKQIADSRTSRSLSPEVVASSAFSGMISGPGWYQQPEGTSDVVMGEGDGVKEDERMITTEEAIEKIIDQVDNINKTAESKNDIAPETKTTQEIEVLPDFPSKVEGELLFCDADNINVSCHFLPSTFLIP